MAKSVAQRKRDERKRKEEHLAAVGAKPFNMDMYSGTTGELERIKTAASFKQDAEAITVMIHNVAALIDRDLSLFKELTSIENLRKSA